mmetsp:Transcript_13498/g.18503  ORF Transcript_13498/g.18503 Transcript_13498/m.18503 type:complete len:211 (+) Transcript_13498:205-837(+)|eukprot:CAMPEP_0196582164 /NCGR_PEP_ID=MMETSP1081-20130531/37749_1 /TAXON_ID=36882 /ORGANISM="Pyramimonas amylifera, Strain CCMP720" /LENGTH=210 /DNA_ID=CAMNT_0041902651 /DNA_START=200 /DNA_END=832 /DNA_ORIENTATION=-
MANSVSVCSITCASTNIVYCRIPRRHIRSALPGSKNRLRYQNAGFSRKINESTFQKLDKKQRPFNTQINLGEDELHIPAEVDYSKLLLCVFDTNPYLGNGSRKVLSVGSSLASKYGSAVTILVLDEPEWTLDEVVRSDTIKWHLNEHGQSDYELLIKTVAKGDKGSIMIADLADEIDSSMVVLSTDTVEGGLVDANILAKFIGCDFLFIE